MTRLKENDICDILERLETYDGILHEKTGGGLAEIAAFAAGCGMPQLQEAARKQKIGIVPVTSGAGLIDGFSKTIQGIFSFLGTRSFITGASDVGGLAEAAAHGATAVFLADDETCSLIHLRTGRVADNSLCTGRGFAAALRMKAGTLKGKVVSILGAGPVGWGAMKALTEFGAETVIYDCSPERLERFRGLPGVTCAASSAEALEQGEYYFEATTSADTIREMDFAGDTLVAAPGVPLGVEKRALSRHEAQVIHDVLEIGVATMLFTILAEE